MVVAVVGGGGLGRGRGGGDECDEEQRVRQSSRKDIVSRLHARKGKGKRKRKSIPLLSDLSSDTHHSLPVSILSHPFCLLLFPPPSLSNTCKANTTTSFIH